MTAPTFRPIDAGAYDDDTALSAEHGRRLVRDTLAGYNERCVQSGGAFRRYVADGEDPTVAVEIPTLLRWSIGWAYIGPFVVFVPAPVRGVRLLLGTRTNGGAGAVRVYAWVTAADVDEEAMDLATDSVPVSEGPGYRVTATDQDFALTVDLQAGDNQVWIAIRCEEDTDRTPEVFSGLTNPRQITIFSGSSAPAVIGLTIVDTDPVGMVCDLAEDSAYYGFGLFDSYTVAALVGSEDPVLFEPSVADWSTSGPSGQVTTYAVIRWVTALYIDSISLDGSQAYTLEDRSFGPAFRYRQYLSASFAGQAMQEAAVVHRARLPVAAAVGQLGGYVPDNEESGPTFPALRRYLLLTTTDQTLDTVCLGVAAATPAIDWQALYPGREYVYEVRFWCVAVQITSSQPAASSDVTFSADIVDASATVIDAGTEQTSPVALFWRLSPQPLATQAFASSDSLANVGTDYGAEGMCVRGDTTAWTPVFVTVKASGDLDDNPVQRLVIRARLASAAAGVILVASHPFVRLVEG
jgi:hypothetical protein